MDTSIIHLSKKTSKTIDIRDYLNYDPETGVFSWIKRPSNKIHVGDVAGCVFTCDSGHQYLQITFQGKKKYAHRLAFLFVEGEYPENHVHHKNGNTLDNRFSNLTLGKVMRKVNMVWKKYE